MRFVGVAFMVLVVGAIASFLDVLIENAGVFSDSDLATYCVGVVVGFYVLAEKPLPAWMGAIGFKR